MGGGNGQFRRRSPIRVTDKGGHFINQAVTCAGLVRADSCACCTNHAARTGQARRPPVTNLLTEKAQGRGPSPSATDCIGESVLGITNPMMFRDGALAAGLALKLTETSPLSPLAGFSKRRCSVKV
jgi:hypothetical protein